jgi:hypothetical protein
MPTVIVSLHVWMPSGEFYGGGRCVSRYMAAEVVGQFELITGDERQNQNWERTGVPARAARVGWS